MRIALVTALVAVWLVSMLWVDLLAVVGVFVALRLARRARVRAGVRRLYAACGLICRGRGAGVWRSELALAG